MNGSPQPYDNRQQPSRPISELQQAAIFIAQAALLLERRRRRDVYSAGRLAGIAAGLAALVPSLESLARSLDHDGVSR